MTAIKEEIQYPMSDYPEVWVDKHWDDKDWEESEMDCPDCKDVRMWKGSWYDDSPQNGGACIGSQFYCGNCGNCEYL